jgi:hypothetical protein
MWFVARWRLLHGTEVARPHIRDEGLRPPFSNQQLGLERGEFEPVALTPI